MQNEYLAGYVSAEEEKEILEEFTLPSSKTPPLYINLVTLSLMFTPERIGISSPLELF
ncbi:MAG: hypothetical protein AABX66_03240 [Nanoarchaeota archaeon]